MVLLIGAIVIGLSLWFRENQHQTAAIVLFVVATIAIFTGLIGLYFQMRNRNQSDNVDERPRELHVYRENPFTINKELVHKYQKLEEQLVESVKELSSDFDWKEHTQLLADAAAAEQSNDWQNAFRYHFLGVQLLIRVLNNERGTIESFQPNWTGKK